jgi:phenylpropionate dioxygenase-like ring-hydroxylating dioxygenase large terminal subunit
LLSSELPQPDSNPVRLRLLGEDLIALRDSAGRVGVLRHSCPHRGASLYFGRNEEGGLRCVYHGWKFDVTGACLDMPNEPPESNFKDKVRAGAYPSVERAGVIWTYMGSRREPPALPQIEANMLPDGEWTASVAMRECNWFQALEGDIDTSHTSFLHWGAVQRQDARPGTFMYYRTEDRAPRYRVVETEFGAMYGAYRPAEDDTDYWRIACYLFPFWVIIPTGLLGHQIVFRGWVPIDDTHTMWWSIGKRREFAGRQRPQQDATPRANAMPYDASTSDWLGRFRLRPNAANDYLIDRDKQRRKDSYTGIDGVHIQDQAVTESEGPIYDRSQEHLVSSDAMIIRTRQRVLRAARALQERGEAPPGVDNPAVYAVRGGGVLLPRGADWLDATAELRKAFVDHPELDPAIVG